MNQRLWSTLAQLSRGVTVLAALSIPLGGAAPAKAQGPNPTPISSCPYTITRPGRYILTANCSVGSGLTGITITAPNVQLDLNGHTLTGAGSGIGIEVSGDDTPPVVRAAVSNGTIQQFQTGVLVTNARASSLTSLTVNNNSSFGIDLESSHNCLVSGNTLTANGTSTGNCGILVGNGSTQNTVELNIVNANRAGIRIQNGGSGIRIEGNTANGNFGSGIRLDLDSNGNSVQRNTTNGNGTGVNAAGISLAATASGNLISGNTAQNNTSVGIDVASDNNSIQNNNTSNNTAAGIVIRPDASGNGFSGNQANGNNGGFDVLGDNNTIQNNTTNSNNFTGIILRPEASGNHVSGNQANSNTNTGIDVQGDNNTLQNNTTNSNTNTGIVIRPEASGNTISSNQANNNGSAIVFGNGMDVQGPSNFIQHNTLNGNTNAGILLRAGGNGTIVSENQAGGNGGAGIDVDVGSTFYTIGGNTSNTNLIGILVRSTAIGNTLDSNTAQGSTSGVDLEEDNAPSNGTCPNIWTDNTFGTKGGVGAECIS
jgi:parallel beta-helix repeat protein